METNLNKTESKFKERVRIALTNAESHTEIKPLMSELGYDEAKISEGWSIFETFQTSSEKNEQEDIEKDLSSKAYKKDLKEFNSLLKRHRNQCGILFKKDPESLVKLGVKGSFPTKYNKIFDFAKHFYKAIQKHSDIQDRLVLCKITPELVTDCLSKLENVKSLRATYYKEAGEAQNATEQKNVDLIELKNWIEDFDIIAKIALYDKPQLLEVLGIFVRS